MNEKLVNSLNLYLSDLAVMYIKLHNLHWNVVGSDFKQVHEYLESLYDEVAETLDGVAELLKTHEVQPMASMKDYLSLSKIEELPSKEIHTKDALSIVKGDLDELIKQAEAVRSDAKKADVYDVEDAIEQQLASYHKTLWFVRSMLK